MNLTINQNTKIFIMAPANAATGGPELLHQLAFHLRETLSLNAYMFYWPMEHPAPIHPAYTKYNNPFAKKVDDHSDNILIVPELYEYVQLLRHYKNIQKVLWWLSVDNFYISMLIHKRAFFARFYSSSDIATIALRKYKNYNFQNDPAIQSAQLHLVQSFYAKAHLESKKIENIAFLSDYLNDDFFDSSLQPRLKENLVAYNPKKGYILTRKIMDAAPDIRFIPIENMTRPEVVALLLRAKVYIDFGNHPGKDRIPREAAICGCCVITGQKGSAAFAEDLPIPDRFKFNDTHPESLLHIISAIRRCMINFSEEQQYFTPYIESIKNEKKVFIENLKAIFGQGKQNKEMK